MSAFEKKTEIIWIGVSQAVLITVNFLLLKLLTTRLSVESFGYYSLCMTIVLFSRQIIYDPISIVVAKNCGFSVNSPLEKDEAFKIVRFLTDRLAVAFFILGLFFALFTYGVFDSSSEGLVVWSSLVYLCANGAQGVYFNVLNTISDRKSAALLSMLDSFLKLLLVFLAFRHFGSDVVFALMSISVGAVTVLLGARWYVETGFSGEVLPISSLKLAVKSSIVVSMPLYLPTLFVALKNVGDRWILAAFIGVDELAVYSVLLQLGYFPMILLVGIVQTFVAPKIYGMCAVQGKQGGDGLRIFIIKILSGIFLFSCAACGVAVFVANWVFQLFVGSNYGIFSFYLPLFIVAGSLAAVGGVLHLAATGVFETRVLGRLLGVTVGVNIILTLLLIYFWGFIGAVLALLFGGGVSGVLYWIALSKSGFCRG